MSMKNYFCEGWELSTVSTTDTKQRANEFIERFKKFEDFLDFLDLNITEIRITPTDYELYIHIDFEKEDRWLFSKELELINAYLEARLPMKSYKNVLKPELPNENGSCCLEYKVDTGSYKFPYPSLDYFYMSLYS